VHNDGISNSSIRRRGRCGGSISKQEPLLQPLPLPWYRRVLSPVCCRWVGCSRVCAWIQGGKLRSEFFLMHCVPGRFYSPTSALRSYFITLQPLHRVDFIVRLIPPQGVVVSTWSSASISRLWHIISRRRLQFPVPATKFPASASISRLRPSIPVSGIFQNQVSGTRWSFLLPYSSCEHHPSNTPTPPTTTAARKTVAHTRGPLLTLACPDERKREGPTSSDEG
jgi:hypothetical protein